MLLGMGNELGGGGGGAGGKRRGTASRLGSTCPGERERPQGTAGPHAHPPPGGANPPSSVLFHPALGLRPPGRPPHHPAHPGGGRSIFKSLA